MYIVDTRESEIHTMVFGYFVKVESHFDPMVTKDGGTLYEHLLMV